MSFRMSKYGQPSAVLATPANHYRDWTMTVRCPNCRDAKQIHIEQHISDGRGRGETVSRFITRLRCATCRRMPDTIKLHKAKPRLEIILLGPGAY
jgi:hypothetical protein